MKLVPQKKASLFTTVLFASSMLAAASSSHADWSLNNEQSHLSFVSIKSAAVAELNTFKTLSGTLTDSGDASLSIDLASVDTLIPIRDERLLKVLSNAGAFPKAELTAKVDTAAAKALKAGETLTQDISLTLTLHGHAHTLPAKVKVTALSDGKLAVSTLQPVIVNASDFQLVDGVNELKSLAGLPSISTAVPVTVDFVFDAQ